MASSRSGRHGGRPQSWPCWLNASGGAPTCTPIARTSCSAQPSAPSGSHPTARSCTTRTPTSCPTPCTSASWRCTWSCSHAWNATRGASSSAARGRRPGPPGAAAPRATASTGSRTARPARRRSRTATGRPARRRARAARPSATAARSADRLAAHTRSCSIRSPTTSGRSTSTWARVASSARAVGVEVGHAQGQRRGEPPARRRVGRRLHRRHGRDRVQRVEQHRLGAVLAAGPADELAQVAEVADAPRPLRAQRVELQHPAPRPRRLRERGGRHDHGDVAAELLVDQLQAVVAGLEVVGQLGDVRARALGVDQHARPGQRPHRADAVRDRARQRAERRLLPGQRQRGRPGLRLGRVDVEQAEDADDDVVVDLDDLAFAVAVGGGDAVRGRQLDQVGVHDPIVPRRPGRDAAGCVGVKRPPRRRRPRGARRRGR